MRWKLFVELGYCRSLLVCPLPQESILCCQMFEVKQCYFICLSCFGVIIDRRINVFFDPLCRLKWRSPCNQNSLNALWMLGTDFCAWVQTWLGLSVGALVLGSPSLAGETCQLQIAFAMWYVQFSSVSQSCLTLCNPVDCSTPGLAVLHQILELGKLMSIELVLPSNHLLLCHPLSSCLQSCPVTGSFLMSQFFISVGQSIGGSISASVLAMNIQDWFPLGWLGESPYSPRDCQESRPTPQFKTINSSLLTILYGATVTSIHDNWKNLSFDYTELFQQSNLSTFKKFV